jgi:broad specificity phosphatase PhoE
MILMRHGQSHFNVAYAETRKDPGLRDPGLTDLGREQVAVAAAHLEQEQREVRRIVASPYTRALETADIVGKVLGLPVAVDPTVGERAVFTCDIGTPRSHLEQRWPEIALNHVDEEWWPAREESEPDFHARSLGYRTRLANSGDWGGTLVVCHWGFIRALTGHGVQNADLVAFDPTAPHPGGGTVVPVADPC